MGSQASLDSHRVALDISSVTQMPSATSSLNLMFTASR